MRAVSFTSSKFILVVNLGVLPEKIMNPAGIER